MAAAAAQTSLPHTLTNGHSKGHVKGDDTSSSSQADEDSSSDSLAAGGAAVDEARVQTQEAAVSGVGSAGVIGGVGQDVFDEDEADPAKCRAIESSLWELESLKHHYYHAVSYMRACIFPLLHVTKPSPCLPMLVHTWCKVHEAGFLTCLATALQGSDMLAIYLRS